MEMSMVLQVALFFASVAVVVFVSVAMVLMIRALHWFEHFAEVAGQLKADVRLLVQHSEEVAQNIAKVTQRASEQLDDVEQVVGLVRQWAERTDHVLNEIGAAIEPRIFSFIRNASLIGKAATTVGRALFQRKKNNHYEGEEESHGRE
jgi:hypothetical protein